jgi:hypothetical protein
MKLSWPISRHYLDIRLKVLAKATSTLNYDNRCSTRDSNRASPEYNLEALPPELTCSVMLHIRDVRLIMNDEIRKLTLRLINNALSNVKFRMK